MFCVKLWDVECGGECDPAAAGGGGVAIPFQNGIDAPAILHASSAPTASSAASRTSQPRSGRRERSARRARWRGLRVGAFDGMRGDAAEAFVAAATAAGIDCALAPDIRRALWEKFVFLSALSGITCLTRQPLGVVRARPADARDVRDDHARNVERWSRDRRPRWPTTSSTGSSRSRETLPAEMRASMLHDLVAGNRLEAPWLCGAVVRLGNETGVATPVNATVYAALIPYLDGAH